MAQNTTGKELIKLLATPKDIENLSKWGVYKIYHISDPSKFYIGSTACNQIKAFMGGFYIRWLNHLSQLRRNAHPSIEFQKHINKLGVNGLRFTIIEVCKTKKQSMERESDYITLLNPEFNSQKKVYQFSLNGEFIREYKYGTIAAKETGIDRGSINNTCLGNRYSAGGFLWSFTDKPKIKLGRLIVQMCELDGYINYYETLADAAKAIGTCSSNAIRNAITGVQHQAYGYKWRIMTVEERRASGLLIDQVNKKFNEPHKI